MFPHWQRLSPTAARTGGYGPRGCSPPSPQLCPWNGHPQQHSPEEAPGLQRGSTKKCTPAVHASRSRARGPHELPATGQMGTSVRLFNNHSPDACGVPSPRWRTSATLGTTGHSQLASSPHPQHRQLAPRPGLLGCTQTLQSSRKTWGHFTWQVTRG